MSRPVHITGIRRDPPDLDRFVAALLALAIARVEAEQADKNPGPAEPGPKEADD